MKSLIAVFFLAFQALAQNLPSRWDELVATDWPKALEQSDSTCILPIGILEKHGPHDPIGSDLIHVREWAKRATAKEYAVVFPDYYFGQINEARHQPGAVALPTELYWKLLDATCEEIGRNGFRKILIINGHGGSVYFLRFFIQSQLEKRHNYVVYLYNPTDDSAYIAHERAMRKSDPSYDGHAGENETSTLLYLRPDLVKIDRANVESGKNQKRLILPDLYTGIWWYGGYPNQYAGEGSTATKEYGEFQTEYRIASIVKAIKTVKADTKSMELQNEFFDRVEKFGR